MQIIVAFDGDIQQYLAEFQQCQWDVVVSHCPICHATGPLICHGVYWRKPRDHEQVYATPIRRWLCKTCHHTISALPNILLPRRWYVLNRIQVVLLARFTQQRSWRQLAVRLTGTPHLRTAQRWCSAFQGQARSWLAAVQIFLARQDSLSPLLDPTGEAPLEKSIPDERNTEIALFRYGLIAHLLLDPLAAGQLKGALREIAAKTYSIPYSNRRRVGISTLRRYLQAYNQGGFDALRPKARSDRCTPRAFSPEILEKAIALREEQPARTPPCWLTCCSATRMCTWKPASMCIR